MDIFLSLSLSFSFSSLIFIALVIFNVKPYFLLSVQLMMFKFCYNQGFCMEIKLKTGGAHSFKTLKLLHYLCVTSSFIVV